MKLAFGRQAIIIVHFTFFYVLVFTGPPLITVIFVLRLVYAVYHLFIIIIIIITIILVVVTSWVFMVWTHWHHFPDCKAILLFPSNGTSSARFKRLTGAYIFMPGVGMACTHFLSHCFLFLGHIVETKKKTSGHVWHLKQVNLPASDSIVHSLYLQYVAASTWENWKRNTVDVVSTTSSEFLYRLYHQKHSLRNRAFFTPFSHMGYQVQVQFCHNSTLQILIPKGAWGPNPKLSGSPLIILGYFSES